MLASTGQLDPLTIEQRARLAQIEAAMLAERARVWLPWIAERDLRLEVLRGEAGLGPDRFRRRLRRD